MMYRVKFCEEEYTVEFIFWILLMILSYAPVVYYAQISMSDQSFPFCYSAEKEKHFFVSFSFFSPYNSTFLSM